MTRGNKSRILRASMLGNNYRTRYTIKPSGLYQNSLDLSRNEQGKYEIHNSKVRVIAEFNTFNEALKFIDDKLGIKVSSGWNTECHNAKVEIMYISPYAVIGGATYAHVEAYSNCEYMIQEVYSINPDNNVRSIFKPKSWKELTTLFIEACDNIKHRSIPSE